ncbi:tetratricopeptide repeat protein [uncultured Aquimarina sp.]|uniref:tetratricopeptide repeat protein n=1 Tax=uncultured Aquimarina sp. TaxID=575652 RepID=UPI002634D5D5|nr:tetratricopeptide repeat protein [uncultured Aquimarina sp.]
MRFLYVVFCFLIISVNGQNKIPENPKGLRSYYNLGEFYKKKSIDSSLLAYRTYLRLTQIRGVHYHVAESHSNIGNLLFKKGLTKDAFRHLDSAKYFFELRNDSVNLIKTKFKIGNIHLHIGQTEEASEVYFDILKEIEHQNGYSAKKCDLYNNIGIIYSEIGDFQKSDEYVLKALEISKKLKKTNLSLAPLASLGNNALEQKQYDKALQYFRKYSKLADSLNKKSHLRNALNNISYTYYLKKDYNNSVLYAKKSLQFISEDVRELGSDTYHTLGVNHLELGNYKLSEKYLLASYEIAEKHTIPYVMLKCKEDLSRLKQKTKDYKSALQYHKEYIKIKDSFYGSKIKKEIKKLESNIIIEKKELVIKELSVEKKNNEDKFSSDIKIIVVVFTIIIIVTILLSSFYFLRNKTALAENEKKLTESKMEVLRSQMNPHFIFNTIGSIQNYILKSDKYNSYNYLTKFSESIRLIFENSGKSFIHFSKELALIREYINLEKIRFRDKIQYLENIDEIVLNEDPKIAGMIIQPIIENAILHGLSNKKDSGYVKLYVSMSKRYLNCIIEDNGIGRKASMEIKKYKSKKHLSITTINTNQRIEILKKMGYLKSKIEYQDLYYNDNIPIGTRVTLVLPIKS